MMKIPTTVFEVMTLLKSVPDSEKPAAINPGLSVTQAKDIMIKAIKKREGSFSNNSRDIMTLTNALAVIHHRKTRKIRQEVRKVLAGKP